MKQEYPIIKIPNFTERSKFLDPVLEIKAPSKPATPTKPQEPVKKEDLGCTYMMMIPLLFLVIIFKFHVTAIIIAGIVAFFMLGNALSSQDERYQKEVESYKNRTAEYHELTRVFPDMQKAYETSLTEFERHKEHIFHPHNINKIRQDLYFAELAKTSKPLRAFDENEFRTGIAEKSFFSKLKSMYPNEIFRNITLDGCSYQPDIVYWNRQLNICIDIEIDEPYAQETGEPIHFVGSSDEIRDRFFVSNGWFIIRFAEVQTIKNTDACLSLVNQIIQAIQNRDYQDILFPLYRANKVEQWTKDEAHKLAYQRHREKYLSI